MEPKIWNNLELLLTFCLLFYIIIISFGVIIVESTNFYQLEIGSVSINDVRYVAGETKEVTLNQTYRFAVTITNNNSTAVNCRLNIKVIKGLGEILPSKTFNVSVPGGYSYFVPLPPFQDWQSGVKIVTFILKTTEIGDLFLQLELLYENKMIDSFPVNLKVVKVRSTVFVPLEPIIIPVFVYMFFLFY